MSGIINKVKDALHSDKSTTHSTTGTHATGTHTAGTHTTGTHAGTAEGVAGPHTSRVANAADPRVDSDRDGSRHVGTTGTHAHTGTTGTTGTGIGHSSTGPVHNSSLLNKADPRVDSDADGSRNMGATQAHTADNLGSSTHGVHPTSHTTHATHGTGVGSGIGGTTHGTHNTHSTTHGTHGTTAGTYGTTTTGTGSNPVHNSSVLNKVDPRVDSDADGSRNMGATKAHTADNVGSTTHGTHSTHATHGTGVGSGIGGTTHGTHNTHSTTHGTHGAGVLGSHATPGSGTAQHTAGPHNSDLANKLDPRVDADMDGSKTYGGNKTFT